MTFPGMRDPTVNRVGHARPRVGLHLLQSERHAHLRAIELQNLHIDFVARPHNLRWAGHAAPGHVRDVQQAIQSAEVDKSAVAGDVLHDPAAHLPFGERVHQLLPVGLQIHFENRAPANHHISALAIQLDDANLDLLILPGVEILHGPQVHLRGRKKRSRADFHHQATLDVVHDAAGQVCLLAVGLLDVRPGAAAPGAEMREDDVAVLAIACAEHFNRLAGIELDRELQLPQFQSRGSSLPSCRPNPRPRQAP